MSRDILDLIDNAIAGATSEDAMRWTPDAEKSTGDLTEADVARIFDVPVALIQDPPRVHGFTAPTIRSPIWTQVWEDPHTQRMWIAPLGTPQPVGPIEDNPVWVEVDFARGGDMPATTANVSLAESLSSFLRHAGAAIAPAGETMREAGMISDQPPEDPMARALWLRQHRNTGPAVQSRAPRRIDARRTR